MILRNVMAAKLHGIRVTHTRLFYSGSIALPRAIIEAAGFIENDQVAVYNFNSGARYETYVIHGKDDEVSANGPSARLSAPGDRLAIVQYVLTDEILKPRLLFFNEFNRQVAKQEVFPGEEP